MHGWLLAIIALGLPALELAGIYLIWQKIGPWTLAWLLGAVMLGVWLLRRERLDFLPRLAQAMTDGHTPFAVLFASFRRVLAGLLFIFPGAGSDLLALLLLIWPGGPTPRRPPPGPPPGKGPRGEVIEGEYRRVD